MSASFTVEHRLASDVDPTAPTPKHHGDVQRLPGGSVLVTYSNASIIQEIDLEQNVVLEIDGGQFFGYSTWTETLYARE